MGAQIGHAQKMAGAIDKAMAAVARRQHGYVNRAQVLALGLTPKAIRWRCRPGWLIPGYGAPSAVRAGADEFAAGG